MAVSGSTGGGMLIGSFCSRVAAAAAALCVAPVAHISSTLPSDPYSRTVDPQTSEVVLWGAGVWGLYVDNEQPGQCQIVASDRARGWHHVVAGNAPGHWPWDRCPGAINALEWYPFGGPMAGAPISPPRSSAYILQWSFSWPGSPAPTFKQRERLLRAAEAEHPKLILLY